MSEQADMPDHLTFGLFRDAVRALKANDRQAPLPLRYYALPNELAAFGGAERLGLAIGAEEVWSRPPIGEAPQLLWSLR